LKNYLNRYYAFLVQLPTPNKEMVVTAFVKGMWASPFSDSLIRNRVESMDEVRKQFVSHTEVVEVVIVKNNN